MLLTANSGHIIALFSREIDISPNIIWYIQIYCSENR